MFCGQISYVRNVSLFDKMYHRYIIMDLQLPAIIAGGGASGGSDGAGAGDRRALLTTDDNVQVLANDNNVSGSGNNIDDNGHGRDERLARVEVAVLAALLVLTVLGNAVVLLALYARRRCGGRRKLSRMFYFILHLSVADMLTAIFSVLPQLVWKVTFRFQGGNLLCKAVKFGQPLGVYLSSYVLTATALDRYRAICHPLTYCSWSSRRAKAMVWCAWVVAVLFSLPQAFIFSVQKVTETEEDCWGTFHPEWGVRAYVTWYSVSVFLFPLAVLMFTYSRICCEIWRSASGGHTPVLASGSGIAPPAPPPSGQSCQHTHAYAYRFSPPSQAVQPTGTDVPSASHPGTVCKGSASTSSGSFISSRVNGGRVVGTRTNPLISRAKINTVKQTVLVIAIYIICSAPFICVQLWAAWGPPDSPYLKESGPFYTILTLLFSLNSCVNPWIYLAFNRDLVRMLWLLLSCQGPATVPVAQSSCSSPVNGPTNSRLNRAGVVRALISRSQPNTPNNVKRSVVGSPGLLHDCGWCSRRPHC